LERRLLFFGRDGAATLEILFHFIFMQDYMVFNNNVHDGRAYGGNFDIVLDRVSRLFQPPCHVL